MKHGARIYPLTKDTVLVKQTVQRRVGAEYVIDEQRERHVSLRDDAAVASAVRDALAGRLSKGKAGG